MKVALLEVATVAVILRSPEKVKSASKPLGKVTGSLNVSVICVPSVLVDAVVMTGAMRTWFVTIVSLKLAKALFRRSSIVPEVCV